jgi:hypothetical protein
MAVEAWVVVVVGGAFAVLVGGGVTSAFVHARRRVMGRRSLALMILGGRALSSPRRTTSKSP